MEKKDKRVRINKVMVGWSNGHEVHLPPSIRREVSMVGEKLGQYHRRVEEGYEYRSKSAAAQAEAEILSEEAQALWNQGMHVRALKLTMEAAGMVLERDDDEYREYLDPLLNPPQKAFISIFLRLAERCEQWCREDSRLWPVFKDSITYGDLRLVRYRYRHWL